MVQLDWKRLSAIEPESLAEEEMDEISSMLVNYTLEPKDSTVDKLSILYGLSRAIMQSKVEQAEILLEELDQMAEEKGRSDAQEQKELLDEIKDLKNQLREEKQKGHPSKGRQNSGWRDEIVHLEKQIATLERDIKHKERDLAEEKRESKKIMTRTKHLEQENVDLKREVDATREELAEFHKTLDLQQEKWSSKFENQREMSDAITEKNRQINQLLEDFEVVEKDNMELQNKIKSLERHLTEGTKQMNSMASEYISLKDTLRQMQAQAHELTQQNYSLQVRIEELEHRKHKRDEDLDQINLAVDTSIDQWKTILAERDAEIEELELRLAQFKIQATNMQFDTEQNSIVALAQSLEDRNKQIEKLHHQLAEATKEIETSAKIISELKDKDRKKHFHGEEAHNKIVDLQQKLQEQNLYVAEMKTMMKNAEEEAHLKDKELSTVVRQLREYESGEYGLADAIGELKETRRQVKVRDRQLEEMNAFVNEAQYQLQEVMEENTVLRAKLGMEMREAADVSDFSSLRRREKAFMRELQTQIELLEEENIKIKMENRALKQSKTKFGESTTQTAEKTHSPKAKQMAMDLVVSPKRQLQAEKELQILELENERLEAQRVELEKCVEELQEENAGLRKGLEEILESVRNQDGLSDVTLEAPVLEDLMAVLDTRSLAGKHIPLVGLRVRVDALEGKNAALREQLKLSRLEGIKMAHQLGESNRQMENLKSQQGMLKQSDFTAVTASLPATMTTSSAEIISKLNTQLLHVLSECEHKEEVTSELEKRLEEFSRKIGVIRHQLGLVYKDYKADKEVWNQSKSALEEEKIVLLEKLESTQQELEQYKRHMAVFQEGGDEQKKALSELIRQIAILKSNEFIMCRKYSTLESIERQLMKENLRFQQEVVQVENASTEKIGRLRRYKEMASYKIASLLKTVETSVPLKTLEQANRQYNELTAKYCNLLEREHNLVHQTHHLKQLETEIEMTKHDKQQLKEQLIIAKEKVHSLGSLVEIMEGKMENFTASLLDDKIVELSKNLATTEMQGCIASQKATHAEKMLALVKDQVKELELRNSELEDKFLDVNKANLELQATERELRSQMVSVISQESYEEMQNHLTRLEASEAALQEENDHLRQVAEVAQNQVLAMDRYKTWREAEVESYKQQVIDMQAQGDEKMIIGGLHRHIVALESQCASSAQEIQNLQRKLQKLEATYLRQEQKCDEKEKALIRLKHHTNIRCRSLYNIIQGLRRQYSGSLPLHKQEKISLLLIKLHDERQKISKCLWEAEQKKQEVESKLAETELKNESLGSLLAALKEGNSEKQVLEWHRSNENLRLQALRLSRKNEHLEQKLEYLRGAVDRLETLVSSLEEEKVQSEKEWEEKQLSWEQREVELEKQVEEIKEGKKQTVDLALQEVDIDTLPNPDLPLASQLDRVLQVARSHSQSLIKSEERERKLLADIEELQVKCNELENKLILKNKIICELQLQVPASIERTAKMTEGGAADLTSRNYEVEKAVQVAQVAVDNLKERLKQKEESFEKYKLLMQEIKDELISANTRHEKELESLQATILSQKKTILSLRKSVVDNPISANTPMMQPFQCHEHVTRINELTDEVAQLLASLSSSSSQMSELKEAANKWKRIAEARQNEIENFRENMEMDHSSEIQNLQGIIKSQDNTLLEMRQENILLKHELETQVESSKRGPSGVVKSVIEKLKNQLIEKEKQQQMLNNALTDLRSQMARTMQDSGQRQVSHDTSVEHVAQGIDHLQVDALMEQVEDLKKEQTQLQKAVKAAQDKEKAAKRESKKAKEEAEKKAEEIESLKEENLKLTKRVPMSMGRKEKLEREDLLEKIKTLKAELEEANRLQSESAESLENEVKKVKSTEKFARWDESKKWQKNLEKRDAELKMKQVEIDRLTKQNSSLREIISRLERDKTLQEIKSKGRIASIVITEQMASLQKDNFALKEQVAALQMELSEHENKTLESLQLKNEFLQRRVESQERQIVAMEISKKSSPAVTKELEKYQERESQMQKQILNLEEEKLELRLEMEQLKLNQPRFRERVAQLEKYIETLKEDAGANKGSAKPEVGAQKTTFELEKTILSLKSVIEKLQKENTGLKGKVSFTDKQKNIEQAMSTVTAENKRLRAQFQKTSKERDNINQAHLAAIDKISCLQVELEEAKKKLFYAEEKLVAGGRESQLSSSVTNEGAQRRITQLEDALRRKAQLLSEMKEVLQETGERERIHIQEKEDLKKQLRELGGETDD